MGAGLDHRMELVGPASGIPASSRRSHVGARHDLTVVLDLKIEGTSLAMR
jgi:hypothetical protein